MAVTEKLIVEMEVKQNSSNKKILEKNIEALKEFEDQFVSLDANSEKALDNLKKSIQNIPDIEVKNIKELQDQIVILDIMSSDSFKSINKSMSSVDSSEFGQSLSEANQEIQDLNKTLNDYQQKIDDMSLSQTAFSVAATDIGIAFTSMNVAASAFTKFFGIPAFFGKLTGSIADTNQKILNFSNILKSNALTSVLGFASALGLIAPGLIIIGDRLEESENTAVKVFGTMTKVAGIAAGGIAAAFKVVLFALGDAIQGIGQNMVDEMGRAGKKAEELQYALSGLKSFINGFAREFGDKATGSFEDWNDILDESYLKTTNTKDEIISAIRSIVAQTKTMGLGFEEQVKIYDAALGLAASSNESLGSVVGKINQALSGEHKELKTLGINLDDATLANNDFVKSTGLNVYQLDSSQKSIARYQELLKQTAPYFDMISDKTYTIIGSQKILDRTIEETEAKIGSWAMTSKALLITQIKIATWWNSMPDSLLMIIGVMKDFIGTALVVIGTIIKWTIGALALVSAVNILNTYILSQIGLTFTLSGAFAFLLTKIAPVVLVVESFRQGVQYLSKESTAFSAVMEDIADKFSETKDAVKKTKDEVSFFMKIINKVMSLLSKFAAIVIVGLTQAALLLVTAWLNLQRVFADSEDVEAYSLAINETEKRIAALTGAAVKATSGIGDTILGVESLSANLDDSSKYANLAASAQEQFRQKVIETAKGINESLDISKAIKEEYKDEFEKANQKIIDSELRLKNIFQDVSADMQTTAEEMAKAEKQLFDDRLAAEKLRIESIKKIAEENKNLRIDELKRSGQVIKAIDLETQEKLDSLKQQQQGLETLKNARLEDYILLNESIALVQKNAKFQKNEEYKKSQEVIINLTKNLNDIQKEINKTSYGELQTIIAQKNERYESIKLESDRLQVQGKLSSKAKDLINQMQILNEVASKVRIKEFETTQLQKAKQDLESLNSEIVDLIGLEQDKIDQKLAKDLQSLAIKKEEFELSYKMANLPIPKDRLEVYKKQEAALKKIAKINTDKAPSREFEGAKQVGTDVAQGITQAFQSGTAGAVMGAMTGVGAVADVVQGLIDFVPALLDKISNIFNTIVELPQKIVDGVGKLFDAILNYVANYIPKLLEAIPKLFEKFTSFFEKLPDVIANLLTNLPDMLSGLLDRLPDIVEKFVQKVTEASPKIIVSLITFLIKKGPYIAKELAWAFSVEIPRAIILGFIEALKSLPKIFSQLGKGILPKPAEIAKTFALGIKAASKTLTGVASKLFAVMDLEEGAKSQADKLNGLVKTSEQLIKDLSEAAKNAGKSMWNAFVDAFKEAIKWFLDRGQEIWDGLVEALGKVAKWFSDRGAEIWDGFIQPIVDWFKKKGQEIWDGFIVPVAMWFKERGKEIWDGFIVPVAMWFKERGKEIWDGFVVPVAMWFKERGKEIWDGFIEPVAMWFKERGLEIWNGFIAPIGTAFLDAGTQIWRGLYDSVGLFFTQAGNAIWNGFLAPIANFFVDAGTTIWRNFYAAVSNFFEQFGQRMFNGLTGGLNSFDFGNIGNKIWEGLKNGLGGIGGIISGQINGINVANLFSRMFDTSGSKGQGDVETKLGIDVPFIRFAQGGMVPGKGGVPNDSRINDRIVALLSAGEAIIPKSKMDDPAVAGIVQGILSGKIGAPAYALGGVVGGLKKMGGDLAGAFQETIAPVADILDPAKILEQAWASMKGLVWDKVLDMFWEMLSRNKFHDGGLVPGSGEMPSMLKGGEFVLNKSAASSIGVPTLNDLNAGKAPSNNTQNIELNLVINTTQPIDATMIKNKIMPVIREELKRASIDGRTTIYQSGVRTA
jgi:phage-related protein